MSIEKIRKSIRQVVSDMIPVQVVRCIVTKVNKTAQTCDAKAIHSNLEYYDVLVTLNGKDGFAIYPAVGSAVLIGLIENHPAAAFIIQFSEIDEMLIKLQNGFKLHLKPDGTATIRDDTYGGIVKLKELEKNLNALKNYVETMKTAVITGLNAVGAGQTANGPAGAQAFNGAMAGQTIQFVDMENKNITHG